jgi:hypothetical protein
MARHGRNCYCQPCVILRQAQRARNGGGDDQSTGGSFGDKFEGKEIKVITGAKGIRGRFEFFYGGAMHADGPGHGHVVCNDGETINYWRKPNHEGGQVIIDDNWSTEKLARHMF